MPRTTRDRDREGDRARGDGRCEEGQQPGVGQQQDDDGRDERRLPQQVEDAHPPEAERDPERDRVRLLQRGEEEADAGEERAQHHRLVVAGQGCERRRRGDAEARDAETDARDVRDQPVALLAPARCELAGGDVGDANLAQPGHDRDQRGDDDVLAEVLDAEMPRHQRGRGDPQDDSDEIGRDPEHPAADHARARSRRLEHAQQVARAAARNRCFGVAH